MPSLGQNTASHSQLCPQACCCLTPFFNSATPQSTAASKSRTSSAECRHSFAAITVASIFPNAQFTNHESLPSLQESFSEFCKTYPQFSETEHVDQVRAKEYCHLSASSHTCLDYIGIGLFSYSQVQNQDAAKTQVASSSIPGTLSSPAQNSDIPFFSLSCKTGNLKTLLLHGGKESEFESAMKKRIMGFHNVCENDYLMVFTANRTAAFKLVAESYPFKSNKKLLTVYDYESEAVEAMISCSERRGAKVLSAEFSWPRLRIQSAKLRNMIVKKKKKKKKNGLFVFPLHSRVTGARYPYLWMSIAQENGWHVLIDACALGPKDMDSFGLSLFRPDFLICSFYKVFGENPSGFGCLFVKKSVISIMEASSSPGIVNLVPERRLFHLEEDSSGTDAELEQKSLPSLQISRKLEEGEPSEIQKNQNTEGSAESMASESAAIQETHNPKGSENGGFDIDCRCLDQVDFMGLTLITNRTRYLINWLLNSLLKLTHPNTEGAPLVKIYGPKVRFDRAPALAFNVFDWKGEKVEPVFVQKLADRSNISLGYGFLHNLWFADKYAEEKGRVLQTKEGGSHGVKAHRKKESDKLGITVVTAALGILVNFEDIYKLWAFVARFLDADFVEKERWRYTALNQKTVEV